MTEIIVEFFRELIKNDYVTVIIIAMLPIVELRGAIPVAFGMGFNPFTAFITAYLGTSIVVPFLLLLLRPILNAMKKIKFIGGLAQSIEQGFLEKADKVMKNAADKGRVVNGKLALKYKLWAILVFVAVPLPFTGVWTGSAIAAFLDIDFLPAMAAILIGNLIAAVIITLLCTFLIAYLDIILTVLLVVVAAGLVFYAVSLMLRGRKKNIS